MKKTPPPSVVLWFDESNSETDRTIRPASDMTLRSAICGTHLTEEMVPVPGPKLDRMHDLAVKEAAMYRTFGNRQPYPTILENFALILQKRGDAEGAARARAELAALVGD